MFPRGALELFSRRLTSEDAIFANGIRGCQQLVERTKCYLLLQLPTLCDATSLPEKAGNALYQINA